MSPNIVKNACNHLSASGRLLSVSPNIVKNACKYFMHVEDIVDSECKYLNMSINI